MNFLGIFKKKKEKPDGKSFDLGLQGLKAGGFVDYQLQSYQVEKKSLYEEDGERSFEWHLVSQTDSKHRFLSYEKDDGVEYWHLTEKLALKHLPQGLLDACGRDDAPQEIEVEGERYFLQYSGACYFYETEDSIDRDEMIYWHYEDGDEEKLIQIEQWGEQEFEAYHGKYVEDTDFYNIIQGS
ncbi:DUF4178 domain-containing protein [Pseudobacteriovorax antillogorgiicola]|uniref:DUF4178 domain-containing protein n=1 Tax=Pseudobacteriovorax antillogorgiicola TaxID=1513793 RepID=A0A1Y6CXN9_9BACT|nr:DUF4178 domain-containing protein [Pseudobacteriovorax antillogorgiicola]TCS41260.1 uncharacterized protein DUF4178 [Pseudobacteriovorax antillogorgiicola]SMF83743.1 protein of unknown function [Pseudobacteriovorax antillogorgiicola]